VGRVNPSSRVARTIMASRPKLEKGMPAAADTTPAAISAKRSPRPGAPL